MDREIYIGENGLEKQIMQDLERTANPADGLMTVNELVGGYLATKTGVRQSTRIGYVTVQRILKKESFGNMKIRNVKTSDAKLFLIKLQSEGKGYAYVQNLCSASPFPVAASLAHFTITPPGSLMLPSCFLLST